MSWCGKVYDCEKVRPASREARRIRCSHEKKGGKKTMGVLGNGSVATFAV